MSHWDARDTELRCELGLALSRRRVGLGLSVRTVGRRAGLSHTTISRIECGKYLPRITLLHRVGAAINLDADAVNWLLDDIHYQQKLLTALRHWGARNRGPLQALIYALGNDVMDETASLDFTRACMAVRRGLSARQAG